MPTEENLGVGALPDSSASAGTSVENSPAAPLETLPAELIESGQEQISEPEIETETPAEGEEVSDPEEQSLDEEIESAVQETPSDSDLVKKLRGLLKVKYEDYASKVQPPAPQEVPETQKQALELVEGLFEFDVNTGTPTTRKFAENLAKRDMSLAEQALEDLSSVAVDANGLTLGHKFLEKIGLDPYKLDDLRQLSRGELNPANFGIIEVHSKVPQELSEAYKSLSPVNRTDVDVYLDSDNPDQVSAALQTLRNQQAVLHSTRQQEQMAQRQQEALNNEVMSATEAELDTTYTGLLESLKKSPSYTNIKISSEANVDSAIKDSLINQINALGDPRSILAKQAVKTFESQGVKVDLPKIAELMQAVEVNTKAAVTADRMGKMQGRDYSVHIQEANARKAAAVASLVALGNKYFGQALSNLSGVKMQNGGKPKGGVPSIEGSAPAPKAPSNRAKTFAELDSEIQSIAKSLASVN